MFRRSTRFEELEPVRRPVREPFDGFPEDIPLGVALRHDHGTPFMSDDFQRAIRFLAPGVFASFRA